MTLFSNVARTNQISPPKRNHDFEQKKSYICSWTYGFIFMIHKFSNQSYQLEGDSHTIMP